MFKSPKPTKRQSTSAHQGPEYLHNTPPTELESRRQSIIRRGTGLMSEALIASIDRDSANQVVSQNDDSATAELQATHDSHDQITAADKARLAAEYARRDDSPLRVA